MLLASDGEAATVRGQVSSYPDGAPLAGVQILARDPQGASAAGFTGMDGRFVLDDVEPGLVRVQARIPQDMNRLGAYVGDVNSFCLAQTFVLPPNGTLDQLTIELPLGGAIQGVLRDAGGDPVSGNVGARGLDTLNIGLSRTGEAAATGSFTILGLASWVDTSGDVLPGAYRVDGALPGEPPFYAPGTWLVEEATAVAVVREQVTSVDLTRPAGTAISGQVQFDGVPVEGAQVAVTAQGFGVVGTSTTGPDGTWQVDDAPGRGLKVRVRAVGSAETWNGGVAGAAEASPLAPSSTLDVGTLSLLPGRTLRVVTEATEPFSGAGRLTLSRPDGVVVRAVPVAFEDGFVDIPDIPPGPLAAAVEISGYLGGEQEVPDGAGPAVVIALSSAFDLAVQVRSRGSFLPVRGALLEAVRADTGEVIASSRTDGDGRAETSGLPEGTVLLRASWEPFCPASPALTEVWSGGARSEPFALEVETSEDAQEVFLLPPDADGDGMDDVWEQLWGLDPGRADGGFDPDADGMTSLEEYRGYTDPLRAGDVTPGCVVLFDQSPPTAGWLLLWVPLLGFVCRRRHR